MGTQHVPKQGFGIKSPSQISRYARGLGTARLLFTLAGERETLICPFVLPLPRKELSGQRNLLKKQDSWVYLMARLSGQTVHCTAKPERPVRSISKHSLMFGSMPCCKVLGLALHLMSQPQSTDLTLWARIQSDHCVSLSSTKCRHDATFIYSINHSKDVFEGFSAQLEP